MAEQWARACCGTQDHLFHELHEDSETAGPGATTRNTNNQKLPILSWPWNTWKKTQRNKTQVSLSKGGREQGEKMAEDFCHKLSMSFSYSTLGI